MEELKRTNARLDRDVQRLTSSVETNTASQTRLALAHERDRRTFVAAIIILAVIALGSGWAAFTAVQTSHQQAQLRGEVLCPLYGIFLGSYDPKTRDNNPDPQARGKYEDAYAKIRRGWQVMGCTDPIVPPRSN